MNQSPRIMCAVDLSWRSDNAFDHALTLAQSRRASLDLLFAVSDRRPFGWRRRERLAKLAALRRRAVAAGVDMKVAVQHGKPADVIVQQAAAAARSPHWPRVALECPTTEYTEQLKQHAWRQLRRLLPLSQELHGRVQVQVSVGLVVDQIVRNVNEWKPDLVVLGVSRRGRIGRLVRSTTGHALRRLKCPVLAVPARRREARAGDDRRTSAIAA